MSEDDLITIPYNWDPYQHQIEALQAFDSGLRRQMHIWHRRAGKDNFAANLAAKCALDEKGTYWIIYPTQTHARQDVWLNIDSDGQRMIDHIFPDEICVRKNDSEMLIELVNGSIIQLKGADSDKLVGANPIGLIFSEWALCEPTAWDYLRPILRVNNGWVIFITTYRGKNHAYQMYQRLKTNKDWFCTIKTIDDTKILNETHMEAERLEGMSEALLQQEYYCSPMAAFEGAYFAEEMMNMDKEGRICPIQYDPNLPVYCAFDLGHSGRGDLTVCVYVQDPYNTPRVIASDSWRQTSIAKIVDDIKDRVWSKNSVLLLPHDGESYEIGMGMSRMDKFKEQHDWKDTHTVSRVKNIQDGIEHVRDKLPHTYIDNTPDSYGMPNNFTFTEALSGYRARPTTAEGLFQDKPLHSPETHWVDAFRTYCSHVAGQGGSIKKKKYKPLDYSRLNKSVFGTA